MVLKSKRVFKQVSNNIPELEVFRMNHRHNRDARISTHVFLTARAFGVQKGFFSGDEDESLKKSLDEIKTRWGGFFQLDFVPEWKPWLLNYKQTAGNFVVHLTMYGLEVHKALDQIRIKAPKRLLITVGGAKVPSNIFKLADMNISIGTQPHSEIAALAIFLFGITDPSVLYRDFENAQILIHPNAKEKEVTYRK